MSPFQTLDAEELTAFPRPLVMYSFGSWHAESYCDAGRTGSLERQIKRSAFEPTMLSELKNLKTRNNVASFAGE
jgi:hypothetical protein